MIYVFDVDGTLTPSRGVILPQMKEVLDKFLEENHCVIATGSDPSKTIEQLGEETYQKFRRAFQCSGNLVMENGEVIHKKDFMLPKEARLVIDAAIAVSAYPVKAGNHVEERQGMMNISFVGRDCTQEQREDYYEWDKETKQREIFCDIFNKTYPDYMAQIGGQISIDIFFKDLDKRQVRNWYPDDTLCFFGDHCQPGGNDHSLAAVADIIYAVSGWRDTMEFIKNEI